MASPQLVPMLPRPGTFLHREQKPYRLTGECRPPKQGESYFNETIHNVTGAFSAPYDENLWICVPVTETPEYPTEVVNLAAISDLKILSGPHDWTEMVIKHGDKQKVIWRVPRSQTVHVCKLHTNKPTYPNAEVWLVESVVKPITKKAKTRTVAIDIETVAPERVFPPLPNMVSLSVSGYELWGYGEPKVGDWYLSRHNATPLLHENGDAIADRPGFGRNRWLLRKK